MSLYRLVRAALAGLALVCGLPLRAAEPVPLADFFRHAVVSSAVMSPGGKHIAMLMAGGAQQRRRLVVVDLKDLSASKLVAGYSDVDVARVEWVNDERLVFTVVDQQSPSGDQWGQGLFAVDREGRQLPRRLIKSRQFFVEERPRVGDRELSWHHAFRETLRDGSNDVVVSRALFDARRELVGIELLRVDTVSGQARSLDSARLPDAFAWGLDRTGVARVALTAKDGKSRLHWKPSAGAAEWKMLREFDTFGERNPPPSIFAVGNEGRLLGGAVVGAGVDTVSLVRIDIDGPDFKIEPLVSLAGYDFSGSVVFGATGELLGVHYLSDAPASHWFDARLKALQQKVDALLPATNNQLDCGDCTDPTVLRVTSTADRQPTVYRLYDVASGKLDVLAQSRPWINPATMATRDMQRFTARDGLGIPVHVTRPRGVTRPAPTVLLVHGGPWVRGGYWQWDEESQFLASRGYVVIEPEFRGSVGFGRKHHRASWKQWGLAMQDDLVDAVKWATAQGLTDPGRVCIAGASYGGYATMMGLIRDPEVFRCGIEWVGVSDIDLMYSIHWSDFSEMYKKHGMPVLVGDRVKDAAQLEATSPLKQAARLARPLLMAHGSDDWRVPLEHGQRFYDAVKRSNPDVEFVVYPGEGHGFMLEKNNVDFWSRAERFLARHLGPGATPP